MIIRLVYSLSDTWLFCHNPCNMKTCWYGKRIYAVLGLGHFNGLCWTFCTAGVLELVCRYEVELGMRGCIRVMSCMFYWVAEWSALSYKVSRLLGLHVIFKRCSVLPSAQYLTLFTGRIPRILSLRPTYARTLWLGNAEPGGGSSYAWIWVRSVIIIYCKEYCLLLLCGVTLNAQNKYIINP